MRKLFLKLFTWLCLSTLLLCACADSSGNADIKKKGLTDLVTADGDLIPGEDLRWNMLEDEFLAGKYGSETLDPDNEKFEQHRVSTMDNGWTSYTSPVEVNLQNYNVTASPTCVFDEEDGLIGVVYRITLPADSAEKYTDLLNQLCAEAGNMDMLLPQDENRNFTAEYVSGNNFIITWANETNTRYLEIDSAVFGDSLFMDLRVSPIDLRDGKWY